MACNGKNHRKDCQCQFRGGHFNSSPPRWRPWNRRSSRTFFSNRYSACPECTKPVRYIAFPNGGGNYFEPDVFPLKKHPCTNVAKRYSPYNRRGNPKLRNRLTDFDRKGWLPFFIRRVEQIVIGTIVHGSAMDVPADLHFGFSEQISPDHAIVSLFRVRPGYEPRVEFNYFPQGQQDPVVCRGYENCATEIEFLSKLRKSDLS